MSNRDINLAKKRHRKEMRKKRRRKHRLIEARVAHWKQKVLEKNGIRL